MMDMEKRKKIAEKIRQQMNSTPIDFKVEIEGEDDEEEKMPSPVKGAVTRLKKKR